MLARTSGHALIRTAFCLHPSWSFVGGALTMLTESWFVSPSRSSRPRTVVFRRLQHQNHASSIEPSLIDLGGYHGRLIMRRVWRKRPSSRSCRGGEADWTCPTWSIHDCSRLRKGTDTRLRKVCRECIQTVIRGSIPLLLVVSTDYLRLELFLIWCRPGRLGSGAEHAGRIQVGPCRICLSSQSAAPNEYEAGR